MKPYVANLINAIILVIMGLWGYLGADEPSTTALIPVFVGAVLIVTTPLFKKGNRIIAHVAVVLVLAILIALIKPLSGAIGRSDNPAILRVIVMMISSAITFAIFIRSFVVARIKK